MTAPERFIIGADPGVAPNLALLSTTRGWIDFADEHRTASKSAKGKWRPVGELMRVVMMEWAALDECEMSLEKIGVWTGQGLVSSAEFVGASRLIEGVAIGIGLRVTHYTPPAWKRGVGLLKQDKDASRGLAARLWPNMAGNLTRKMDHNRAEAALIAYHHMRTAYPP